MALEDGRPSSFNPMVICQALESCLTELGITIDDYLTAYRELNKFFHMLGKVFSFVASDVDNKIEILTSYRADPEIGSKYETFESMIEYEEANNLLRDAKRPSGSRTALRLHRALHFFYAFMRELSTLDDGSGTGSVANECYKKTLAHHHPWYVRKTASLAMYALPTRQQLIATAFTANSQIGDGDKLDEEASATMSQLALKSETVYSAVQALYEKQNLLDLP